MGFFELVIFMPFVLKIILLAELVIVDVVKREERM